MDFSVSTPTQALLDRMREFLHARVLPLEPEVLARGFVQMHQKLQSVRAEVKAAGMWGPQLPKELGGLGLSLLDHGLVSEVLGYSPLGHYVFGSQAPDAGNIEILHRYGSEAQKQQWLTPLVDGEIRSCFSMTEPGLAGSNPTRLACTATRDGDSYVINGRKWFTTAADGARFAIVMAVTNPEAHKHLRASMIIVPCDTPGFELVRNIPIFGHAGAGYDSHAEIVYKNCRVPVGNLLGTEGHGFVIAQERLGPGRIHHCMRWIGICERAFEAMCHRAQTREIDEGKPLASRQIIQAWIAESRAQINAARLSVLHTAWLIDNVGFAAAREQISLIKFHVAGVMQQVVDRAIQVHGALGITDDCILSHYYTHERGARIYDGPDEVHKVAASRRILKNLAARKPVVPTTEPNDRSASGLGLKVDRTKPIRAGEELDLDKLTPYLQQVLNRPGQTVEVEQFPGGHSNLTYLVRIGDLEFVLRRPPFGSKVKSAHDMGREHTILSKLAPHFPQAPRPLFVCTDESILGCTFYGMQRRHGVVLRRAPKPGTIDATLGRKLSEVAVDTLANLHNLDLDLVGLADFGKPEGYVERQVSGWTKRYHKSQTDVIPAVEKVASYLAENMPTSGPATLIHNDFKFDNLVLDANDPTRVAAILDWEMSTVGDPLMDLGTALCYWVEKDDNPGMQMISFGPTAAPGFLSRREVAERYAQKTGRNLENVVYYYCFGLFKTAVVTQQIYYRFAKGLTKDPRFAMMIEATKILAGQAERFIGRTGL